MRTEKRGKRFQVVSSTREYKVIKRGFKFIFRKVSNLKKFRRKIKMTRLNMKSRKLKYNNCKTKLINFNNYIKINKIIYNMKRYNYKIKTKIN